MSMNYSRVGMNSVETCIFDVRYTYKIKKSEMQFVKSWHKKNKRITRNIKGFLACKKKKKKKKEKKKKRHPPHFHIYFLQICLVICDELRASNNDPRGKDAVYSPYNLREKKSADQSTYQLCTIINIKPGSADLI